MRRPLGCYALLVALSSCSGEPPPRPPADLCTARYSVVRRRPEIVLVLDRSCAMTARFDGSPASGPADPEGRWGAVREGLLAAIGPEAAGFGLVLVPDDPSACAIDVLRIPPASGTHEELTATLGMDGVVDPFATCGGPTEVPLESALATIAADDDIGSSGEPFVLVIAAGAPSCGASAESLAATSELAGRSLAVLALAPDAEAAALLRAVAQPFGDAAYVEATTAEAARDAAAALVRDRESCVLELEGPTPDPDELRVWVDGVLVGAGADEGWTLSPGDDSITLNGALCERLRAGMLLRVDAGLGCDEPRCVPVAEICDGLDDDCDDVIDEDCL